MFLSLGERMLFKLDYFLLFLACFVLSACTSLYERQAPAPVFGGVNDGSSNDPYFRGQSYPQYPATRTPPPTPPVIQTKPIEKIDRTPELIEIKPEIPSVSSNYGRYEPGDFSEDKVDQPLIDETESTSAAEAQAGQPNSTDINEANMPQIADQTSPAMPEASAAFQPLNTLPQQTPAVGALLLAANENSQAGNLDSAASSIERAIRIEPRNSALYYKLAVIRLDQSKPRLAEDLAKKAALLAVNDNTLKKHSWLLIAKAREQQSNFTGAKKAISEAAKY
jgi:tetratricopeptide (TPR) repeat protein